MTTVPTFSGFPQEGLQFLADLAANNNRDWFEVHKVDYRTHLLEPAQAFVAALGQRLQTLSPHIVYDTRTNGGGSLMRIYRDTRFSKDKTPYKTHLLMAFWEGAGKKMENPGFFIDVEPSGAVVFVGQHVFPKPILSAYRDAVVDEKMGAELAEALDEVNGVSGYTTGGEHYKRVPRGYDAEHERADLLRYNGLYALSSPIAPEGITSPDLVEVCFEHCRNMAPLHRWLVALAQLTDS